MPQLNSTSGCYVKHHDQINEWSQFPCGDVKEGVQACCEFGDICMESSICHFTHPLEGSPSGYYTGGCTDPSFGDPICLQQCSDRGTEDIVYSGSTELWACCGWDSESDYLDCGHPTNQTFQAPGPGELRRLSIATSSSTISPAPTRSTTTSVMVPIKSTTLITAATLPSSTALKTATPTSCAVSGKCSAGLSNGSKTGIGVGSILAGLLILAALVLTVRKFRQRRHVSNMEQNPSGQSHQSQVLWTPPPTQEMDAREEPELDSRVRAEVDV